MEWTQVITIILGNIGVFAPMFLWFRSEANSDRREWAADRREIHQIFREMQTENKEFHAKLTVMEDRYLNILAGKK